LFFDVSEVRLDAGTTKNKEGRTFPFTTELRSVLVAQRDAHRRLKKAGHIFPHVFCMVATSAMARSTRR